MKTKSAKAKGRRLCAEIVELLYKYAPDLKSGDIRVTSSGATGEDVLLSPAALELYPLAIEAKCQEHLNVWAALEQAESHVKDDGTFQVPALFFRRNRGKTYVALLAEDFLRLVR